MASQVSLGSFPRISDAVTEKAAFASSIPVVDISKFENTTTRNEFLKDLEKALKVGFYAVVNPELDLQTIKEGYAAFDRFFDSSSAEKMGIHDPQQNGQRGFVPGETALGSSSPDCKEFVHIGLNNNIWPRHMDLEGPAMRLYHKLKELGQPLLKAMAILLGKEEAFFTNMTAEGENLMRALNYYPKPQDVILAGEHTDIDLMTILPYASEKGLEVKINGKWVPVVVPKNALVVNVGDMSEAYSNGAWPSCEHRVISTTPNTNRRSIVFFFHPTDLTMIRPLVGTSPKYPYGNRLEYLFLRLFSLRLLSKENDEKVINGDFIKRIKFMVDNNTGSESVERWFEGFLKTLKEQSKSIPHKPRM